MIYQLLANIKDKKGTTDVDFAFPKVLVFSSLYYDHPIIIRIINY